MTTLALTNGEPADEQSQHRKRLLVWAFMMPPNPASPRTVCRSCRHQVEQATFATRTGMELGVGTALIPDRPSLSGPAVTSPTTKKMHPSTAIGVPRRA